MNFADSSDPGSSERNLGSTRRWAAVLAAAQEPPRGPELVEAVDVALSLRTDIGLGVLACSVTELDDDAVRTPVWSGDVAVELDLVQYDAGAGPCIDAARSQLTNTWSPVDRRYRQFGEAAVLEGVRSLLSVPMHIGTHLAAMNLYGGATDTFLGNRPQAVAALLTRCVAQLLSDGAAPLAEAAIDGSALAAAFVAQERVSRAQRLLMDEQGLDKADAFAVLAARSRMERRSMAEVARNLLASFERGTDV